jgi:cyclomaltodextrinase
MTQVTDYFFSPFIPPQERRRRCVAHNGVQHASEIFPRDPLPGQAVTLAITTNAALPADHVAVYYTTDGTEAHGALGRAAQGEVVMAVPGDEIDDSAAGLHVRQWQAVLPGQPEGTLVRYRIDAWNGREPERLAWRADAADYYAPPAPEGREFAYHVDWRRMPDWAQDAVIYHIFVDRFAAAHDQPPLRDPGDITGFYGGTLRGVTEKLDYLADLGVTCLWLSPVMESPTYHGYDPTSYEHVARRLGSNDDLRDLITAAHARGLRVLLDFIANHTSTENPAFVEARQNPASPYAEWYTLAPTYTHGYLSYYNVPSMPVLTTDAAPVRDYLIQMALQWLKDFGADGLRLDNVSGPAHAFWTIFQEGIKAEAPDALTLGEVTGGIDDLVTYAGRLDACMDFPLTKMIRRAFAQRTATLDDLLTALELYDAALPASLGLGRLLDNHDMHRFLWLAGGDTRRLKLALVFLLTLSGVPVIYYGTEVGLSQRAGPEGQDAFAREPMPWGDAQQADVRDHTRWLLARRKTRQSLRRGQMARVPVSAPAGDPAQVGALVRWLGDEATLVIFNNAETPVDFAVAPADLPVAGDPSALWLLTPRSTLASAPALAGTLPPLSAAIAEW